MERDFVKLALGHCLEVYPFGAGAAAGERRDHAISAVFRGWMDCFAAFAMTADQTAKGNITQIVIASAATQSPAQQ
ncbi:hypothetical protein [Bradyrhizobium sp.]|uniref:hypothetical protein n=1 Tax=Bradyrhizobium sp. TaxID=376 RepID=UPI003C5C62E3